MNNVRLRKTSSTVMRKLAGDDIASLLLAHKSNGKDPNLHFYANAPWDKLYDAQLKMQQEFSAVIAAAGIDPFGENSPINR
jgi:hypothetical protein